MTDKVQKNQIADILLDFYDEYDSNVINRPMIPNIYAGKILDSLQEEPVSEDLEEAADEYAPDFSNSIASKAAVDAVRDAFKAGAKWQKTKEQPISEDLEEAADNALSNVLNTHEIVNVRSCLEMFKYGAEWKEKEIQPAIELAEDHAMLAGMEKMKEQMMANAIDGEVLENFDGKVLEYDDSILDEKLSNFKVFDKVKIIVINED